MKSHHGEGFQELRVWQDSMEVVDRVYDLSEEFPSSEQFGLVSQLRSAVVSIPSNIAEGHATGTIGLYLRRIRDACGSSAEAETQLLIARRQNYGYRQRINAALSDVINIRKSLFSLRSYLENHPKR